MDGDKLDEIFSLQRRLNLKIGVDTESMSVSDKEKWVLNYARALSQEVAELTDSVPWKWWAKYQTFDEQNAKVEVVDALHFVVSLAQVLGMTSTDVFEAYAKKHSVNQNRQEAGYTQKDVNDSAHI